MDAPGGMVEVSKASAWPLILTIAGCRRGVHRGIHREAHLGGISLQGFLYKVHYVSQQFRGIPVANAFISAEVRDSAQSPNATLRFST
jgi:hypothetical protein